MDSIAPSSASQHAPGLCSFSQAGSYGCSELVFTPHSPPGKIHGFLPHALLRLLVVVERPLMLLTPVLDPGVFVRVGVVVCAY